MSDKRLFAELLDRLERTDALGHTTERLESMSSSVRLLKTQAYADAAKVLTQEFVVYELNYQRQVLLSVVPVEVGVAMVLADAVYACALARPFQGALLRGNQHTV